MDIYTYLLLIKQVIRNNIFVLCLFQKSCFHLWHKVRLFTLILWLWSQVPNLSRSSMEKWPLTFLVTVTCQPSWLTTTGFMYLVTLVVTLMWGCRKEMTLRLRMVMRDLSHAIMVMCLFISFSLQVHSWWEYYPFCNCSLNYWTYDLHSYYRVAKKR